MSVFFFEQKTISSSFPLLLQFFHLHCLSRGKEKRKYQHNRSDEKTKRTH